MIETVIVIGVVAGSLTAIGVFVRKAFISARDFFALQAVAARLVSAEMTTNGGGSLLDKVNRISTNHATAEAHWVALRLQQEAMLVRINAVEEAVTLTHTTPCPLLNDLMKPLGGAA